ncbi:MAG: T9SS type A sorting domain-containing protein, partial [Bacteroidota bacterium]
TDPADLRSFDSGELRTLSMVRSVALDGVERTKAEADLLRTTLARTPAASSAVVESGGSIPVELTTFDAVQDGDAVVLRWTTASETINAGFAVERLADGGAYKELAFVSGAGTTTEAQTYTWADIVLPFESDALRYRLRQVDFDGSYAYSPEVEVTRAVPQAVRLLAPYPNPASHQAWIRYEVTRQEDLCIELLDVLGRRVAVLAEGPHAAGRYEADWSLARLSSGVYQVRLVGDSAAHTRPLVVVR